MKVIATKPGFFGKLRYPGDEFDVPEGSAASWFVDAEKKPVAKPKKASGQSADAA